MEKSMGKTIKINRNTVKADLKNQLVKNGNDTRYYLSLLDDYMDMWDFKNSLIEDIKNRGVYIEYDNGGGQKGTRKNDSLKELRDTNASMLKLLNALGIEPSEVLSDDDSDDEEITL